MNFKDLFLLLLALAIVCFIVYGWLKFGGEPCKNPECSGAMRSSSSAERLPAPPFARGMLRETRFLTCNVCGEAEIVSQKDGMPSLRASEDPRLWAERSYYEGY